MSFLISACVIGALNAISKNSAYKRDVAKARAAGTPLPPTPAQQRAKADADWREKQAQKHEREIERRKERYRKHHPQEVAAFEAMPILRDVATVLPEGGLACPRCGGNTWQVPSDHPGVKPVVIGALVAGTTGAIVGSRVASSKSAGMSQVVHCVTCAAVYRRW